MQKDIEKIAEYFGMNHQQSKAIEEYAEVIHVISRIQTEGVSVELRKNLIEELADAEVMKEQLMFFHEITDEEIEEVKREKVERTIGRHEITESVPEKICGNCKCFLHDESEDSGICGGVSDYRGDRVYRDSTCSQYRKY